MVKDGVNRFIEDFPVKDISKVFGLPSALGAVAGMFGLNDPKYKDGHKINRLPDLSLFTPFGIGKLISHLKNSLFPSGQKETVDQSDGVIPGEAGRQQEELNKKVKQIEDDLKNGKISKEEHDKMLEDLGIPYGGSLVKPTNDNSDAIIDDSSESGGETTSAKLAETNTSSASSSVSDVSSQTTYEESAAGTVILGEPSRGNFAPGAAGDSQYQQAVVMYTNQKEMLNSYFKTQVRVSLYKI